MLSMDANWIWPSIEFFFLVIAGVYVTLLGYGIVGKKPGLDLDYDIKMNKSRGALRICGPLLIVSAVVFLAINLSNR